MKKLTLLLTLYEPTKDQLKYWQNIYFKIKEENNFDFHFLVDGTDIQFKRGVKKEEIFRNSVNIGKLNSIINHIKSGKVKTPYFKVCDPDDFISIDKLNKFTAKGKDYIILHKFSVVNEFTPDFNNIDNQVNNFIENSSPTQYENFGNAYTIYPTKYIYIDKYFSGKRYDAYTDQILGYIAYVNGAKIIRMNFVFYLYIASVGISKNGNFKYTNNSIDSIYEISSLLQSSNKKNPLLWPHNYQQIINAFKTARHNDGSLSRKDLNLLRKKIKKMRKSDPMNQSSISKNGTKLNFVSFSDYKISENYIECFLSIKKFYDDNEVRFFHGTDKETIKKYGPLFSELGIYLVDIEKLMNKYNNFKMSNDTITKTTLARLDMKNIFNLDDFNGPIIYHDIDMIFNGKIKSKYLKKNNFAVSDNVYLNKKNKRDLQEWWSKKDYFIENPDLKTKLINLMDRREYFNAGLMIINNLDSYSSLINKIQRSKFNVDDQSLLNYYNENNIITIKKSEYNHKINNYKFKHAKVFHFCGGIKPWSDDSIMTKKAKKALNFCDYESLKKIKENILQKNNIH